MTTMHLRKKMTLTQSFQMQVFYTRLLALPETVAIDTPGVFCKTQS